MRDELAVHIKPDFVEKARKADVDRAGRLGLVEVDRRLVPVMTDRARTEALPLQIKIGARRLPARIWWCPIASGLGSLRTQVDPVAGDRLLDDERPFERQPGDERAARAARQGGQR